MNDLKIKGTNNSPSIDFKATGELKISGRILTDNAEATFAPMIEWISDLKTECVVFDIELDYMNTSASMKLFDLLNRMEKNKDIGRLIVNWHYEEDDEDHLETGKIFEQKLERAKFSYIEIMEGMEV